MDLVLNTEPTQPFQDSFYQSATYSQPASLGESIGSRQIAFVDRAVDNVETLTAGIQAAEVVLLDPNQDGIRQITETLKGRQGLTGVHIISHGNVGSVFLGNAQLTSDTLATYTDQLQSWADSLTPTGDLLFYGCNVAAGADGQALIQQLSQLTGADVAASTDLTGQPSQKGDWELEYTVGSIETDLAIDATTRQNYDGLLDTTVNYTDFSSLSGLQLNGNAVRAGNTLQVTPNTNGQVGSAYLATPIAIDTDTSFQTQFQFQLLGGTAGADGFAFVLQNSAAGANALGDKGGNLGLDTFTAGASNQVDHSLAVEFDTYKSSWDPNDNHIALLRDGDVTTALATTTATLPDLNSGNPLTAWVDYNGLTNQLDVYLATTTTRPTAPVLSQTLDLAAFVGNQAFIGFAAGTGGKFNAHQINSWSFSSNARLISTFSLPDSSPIFVSEGAGAVSITAARTSSADAVETLEFTTNELGSDDAATADADYITPTLNGRANTGQVSFAIGETEKPFTVAIADDTDVEANETFAVGIQNPSAGLLGAPRTVLVTIVDDDGPATISLSNAAITVSEAESAVRITLQRSGDNSETASINYATNNGSAIAGSDYTAISGSVTFAPGEIVKSFLVPILNDGAFESDETLSISLSNPTGAVLGSQSTSTVTILDNDLTFGSLTRQTVLTGLNQPTTLDWTPDGRYMLIAQKNGVVRVADNGSLLPIPLIDLSSQVNDVGDRGLLGLTIHPDFPNTPYVYLLYTYDPPETAGNTGLAGPDGKGNRPSRLVRVTVNPTTMVADPNSLVVLAGTNSTWAYTSRPDVNSTGDVSILPSGIVNGTTITAPADQINVGTQDNDPNRSGIQNQNIRDYLATDSSTHSIGFVDFGPDGLLYFSNGDGTSFNFVDPRAVRVQDVNNFSGKVLRIDPITGEGVATNPYFNGDPDSNQSKVFYYGMRNPFRFTFDPVTDLPVIGDVGWSSWEEINTGTPGSNFGWPYLEGPAKQGRGYGNLDQAIAFYNNGNVNPGSPNPEAAVFPILSRSHGAPDQANAIMVGDFYNSNTLMFGDIINGTLYAATLNASRQVTNVQVFDSGLSYVVDMEVGPDGKLYGVNLVSGSIVRWNNNA
ncbi:DUF4347 domain-containing protein [Nodosilinea nodulosa]|uniref:DUF4347 domain-containing protein n=1 Tax=Nodosilinea nodulosa TaxID=416001 RepID=UPI000300C21C|nr:DUF4347 domain-containing protein [Nodosilinea nodulosa]